MIQVSAGLHSKLPTLLIVGDVAAGEADMMAEAEAAGVHILRLCELGARIRPAQDLIAFLKLFRILRQIRPQIVHTHTAKAGALGRVAAWLARVPIRVHTFHGHVLQGYFNPLSSWGIKAAERILGRLSTRIIAINPALRDELAQVHRVCPTERITVVPLGLDLDRFRSRDVAARESFREEIGAGSATVVTAVGRLVPIKNHELLVGAAERLVQMGRDCVFVIVGGGPEEPRIREWVRRRGLNSRFRFCGWRRDLARIYAGSDVVVLTSRNEGTPVCLIEALAAGCPVVATAVGGVPDLLEQGKLGLLVSESSPVAFAEAVAQLLDSRVQASEQSRLGAQTIPEKFGIQRLLRDLEALYEDAMRPQHGPQSVHVSAVGMGS